MFTQVRLLLIGWHQRRAYWYVLFDWLTFRRVGLVKIRWQKYVTWGQLVYGLGLKLGYGDYLLPWLLTMVQSCQKFVRRFYSQKIFEWPILHQLSTSSRFSDLSLRSKGNHGSQIWLSRLPDLFNPILSAGDNDRANLMNCFIWDT